MGFIHPRKPNRRPGFDYSSDGVYFVTICTKGREEFFGEIREGVMVLNEAGEIVLRQWRWLENNFEYLELDEFVIMPNHVHGILTICNEDCCFNKNTDVCEKNNFAVYHRRDNPRIVPTTVYNRRHNLLSKTINAYKMTSSKYIHEIGYYNFQWQRSFYDHIIWHERELMEIREYIINNPIKWAFDRNNPNNLKRRKN